MHALVIQKLLDVPTGSRKFKHIVSVIGLNAICMPEHFAGLLLDDRLLIGVQKFRTWAGRGYQEIVVRGRKECSRESAGEFLGTYHDARDIDLADGLHLPQGTECSHRDAFVP